ncbi:hypothetical protein J1N35_000027 [Gossypium stocksii]|uniref:Uncharacterized protein n=1 Tax=Gossypium stocksii TaxID=47602 RepID=A0A9D3WG42_9ROSI|nr:hypothetical protein J1N35_000027 [Gossypium stocksii]
MLGEASMANVGLVETKVKRKENENIYQSTMGALTQARKLYANLAKENKKLLEQNKRLQKHLTLTEKDVEKLHGVIANKQADKNILEVTLKIMDEQHKAAMANLSKSHEEALEKYKRETMQSLQEYLPDLKANLGRVCGEMEKLYSFYHAENTAETSVAPVGECEGNECEGEDGEENETLTDPLDTSANS